RMKLRKASITAALAAIAVAGGYLLLRMVEPGGGASPPATAATNVEAAPAAPPARLATHSIATAGVRAHDSAPADTAPPTDTAAEYDPEQDDGTIAFKADARG